MSDRGLQTTPHAMDVVLRSPPNWTAVGFFAGLAFLHFSIAIPAFIRGHWEGYLSLLFAIIFSTAALISARARYELAVLGSQRRLRLRTGLRRLHFERSIGFDGIRAVRLMTGNSESCIEFLCENEDIACPPTAVPRQQALHFAMLLGVRLIKVSGAEDGEAQPLPEPLFRNP
ncbi:MAG TPA: hypothetical protein VIL86_07835 [Tepidisphaeraceae bacterium]